MGIDEVIAQNQDLRQMIGPKGLTHAASAIPDRIADKLIIASALIGSVDEYTSQLQEYARQGIDFVLLDCNRRFNENINALSEIMRQV